MISGGVLLSFNNNLEIKSKVPRYADLIEMQVNVEHQYEIYVNNKLVHVTYPSCQYDMILPKNSFGFPRIGKFC